jgi:hypothetical protein
MSSLGFTKLYPNSSPIASISGGVDKNKIVYVNPRQFGEAALKKKHIDFSPYKKLLKSYKPKEKDEILHYFNAVYNKNGIIDDVKLKMVYDDIVDNESNKKSFDKLTLQSGSYFKPMPVGDCFSVNYCYGQSGSGKSYYCNMYCENYLKLYPENKVYLITHPEAPDDPAFEDLDYKRLKISKFIDNPPLLEDFNDSLVIFDDYENIKPKELNEIVHKLIDDIASLGRKRHISCFCISHLSTNYKKTKLLLSEANQITCYMHTAAKSQVDYLLKSYGNCDQDQIKYLRSLPSRWITVNKFPFSYISESETGLLS